MKEHTKFWCMSIGCHSCQTKPKSTKISVKGHFNLLTHKVWKCSNMNDNEEVGDLCIIPYGQQVELWRWIQGVSWARWGMENEVQACSRSPHALMREACNASNENLSFASSVRCGFGRSVAQNCVTSLLNCLQKIQFGTSAATAHIVFGFCSLTIPRTRDWDLQFTVTLFYIINHNVLSHHHHLHIKQNT